MKTVTVLTLLAAILTSGCGLQGQIDNLRNDNYQQDRRLEALESQHRAAVSSINGLESQIEALSVDMEAQNAETEAKVALINEQIQILQAMYNDNVSNHYELDAKVDALHAEMDSLVVLGTQAYLELRNQQTSLGASISALQASANSTQTQMAALNSNLQIKGLLNPCGDSAGYDEVLVRFSDGSVMAYFETGGKRHLTVLTPGVQYQTTDADSCQFKVNSSGALVYN